MNSHDNIVTSSDSLRYNFVRELEQRLYDGCSVTFTVSHNVGITVAHDVLSRLKARGCCILGLNLSDVSTIEGFLLRLLREVLQLGTGINVLSDNSIDDLLGSLPAPEFHAKIQDLVEISYLYQIKESHLELLDEAVSLLERIPELFDTRLVVWFLDFQAIAQINNVNLLLKRLRAIFQHQSHVSYAFTGTNSSLMQSLFADRHQPFYRFAVELKFPGS